MRQLLVILLLSCSALTLRGQDSTAATSLNVYLDCQTFGCDFDFFRTELTLVNWVRDRQVADLHLLVTSQATGAGGSEYTVNFIGLRQFAGMTDTLRYVSLPADSDDARRRGLARVFRLGLVRYLARTPAASRLNVSIEGAPGATQQTASRRDRWNAWVIRVSARGFTQGEETYGFYNVGGSVNADRITERWKSRFAVSQSYSQDEFELDDTTSFVTIRRNYGGSLLQVRSVGEHWSVGLRANASSSTYENHRRAWKLSPAAEFNAFPYRESTRRQLRLEYNVGYADFAYHDTTVFDRVREGMPFQRLLVTVATREPWGSIDIGSSANTYLTHPQRYLVRSFMELSLKLFRGFSVNLFGNYDLIGEQFSLAKKNFTPEQILTRQFQRGTGYSYWANIGLSYTFGSIYNNVVNPRMDGGFFD